MLSRLLWLLAKGVILRRVGIGSLNFELLAIGKACGHNNKLKLIVFQRMLLTGTPDDVGLVNIAVLVRIAGILLYVLHRSGHIILRKHIYPLDREAEQYLLSTSDVVIVE